MQVNFKRAPMVLVVMLCLLAGALRDANALPRFSLLSGTRCSACHFNPQGGGLRTELGWSAMNTVGAFFNGDVGLDSLYPEFTNSYLDGLITVGHDIRIQSAKIGRPPNERRMIIPMQLMPYMAVQPIQEITLYGSYNIGGALYKAMSKNNATYAGQADWDAALVIQPTVTAPSLKLGVIQPSIGVRHDDHTVFVRREVAESGSPIIPPNYNEVGAELVYEGIRWLTLNAGIYNAYNLALVDPSIGEITKQTDFTTPSMSARFVLWPQLLESGINMQLGASYFTNGGFRMVNIFGGLGLADKATIMLESMLAENATGRHVQNLSAMGSYLLWPWLSLDWRYEWGQTERTNTALSHAHAFIVGAEIFPLPYVELRPEYRLFDKIPFLGGGYQQGQYTVQLHLFY